MMCSNVQIAKTASKATPISSPNYNFCEELIEWNFGESGILKADNIKHKKVGEDEISPNEYGIKTDIEYYIDLLQWDKKAGAWTSLDNADAQMEFILLDPYYRVNLVQQQKGKPTYNATIKTPDRLGVFQFKVNYTRKGFNYLTSTTKVLFVAIHLS